MRHPVLTLPGLAAADCHSDSECGGGRCRSVRTMIAITLFALVVLLGCGTPVPEATSRKVAMRLTESSLRRCGADLTCAEGLTCSYFELETGREALCVKPGSECAVAACADGGSCFAFLSAPPIFACKVVAPE